MTSPSSIGTEHQHIEGRTVRDIVEYSPEQVNEIWCRKILRQVLQSLELQYAMHMPHRPISPDTIVFHGNGEPLLVPTPGADDGGSEAADLHALAAVIHYAITSELAPAGPLAGRADAYSDSLVAAIDRCMAPDPAARPQTVEALRKLLGIVPLGPVPATQAMPEDAAPAAATAAGINPVLAPARRSTAPADALKTAGSPGGMPAWRLASLSRAQRWALAIGGGGVLLALALVMFAELRDSGADRIVLKLPPADTGSAAAPPALPERARPVPRGADGADHAPLPCRLRAILPTSCRSSPGAWCMSTASTAASARRSSAWCWRRAATRCG
jgi:hypothetical protein